MVAEGTGRRLLIVAFLIFYAVIVLRNAWVCDDAYISFRTVDNFVNGFGLTWNPSERVQAFTHPLWVLILAPLYAVFGNIYFTSIFISIALSLAAIAIYGFRLADTWGAAVVGIAILALSDAFIDYSTSGLENPLTHLLLVAFMYFYFRRELTIRTLFSLCLLAALAAVNRQDTILMYLPMLAYAFWKLRGRKAISAVLLGFSPLIMWEIFSILYFGFPVPNTAYAKLSTGIASSLMIEQGFCYFLNSINIDPLTMLIIGLGLAVPFFTREGKLIAATAGIIFVLIYVLRIGGCFMSGRHFAAPLLLAVITLTELRPRFTSGMLAGIALLILVPGLSLEYSPVRTMHNQGQEHDPVWLPNSITDERKFYSEYAGLTNYRRNAYTWPTGGWVNDGLAARRNKTDMYVTGYIGQLGFFAGPDVHILDFHGLADPLLSRLPVYNLHNPDIGHFRRRIPPGYEESLRSGENRICDSSLAEFYDKIITITRGNIFSLNRLLLIMKFNLGLYDHLIDEYMKTDMIAARLADVREPKPKGTTWNAPGNIVIAATGLRIDLEKVSHAESIEISYDNNDNYRVVFCLGDEELGEYIIPVSIPQIEGLDIISFDIPSEASRKGFDVIKIFPELGDGMYSIGHVTLLDQDQ